MNKKNILSLIILDVLVLLLAGALFTYRFNSISIDHSLTEELKESVQTTPAPVIDKTAKEEAKEVKAPKPPEKAIVLSQEEPQKRNIGFTFKNSKVSSVEVIGDFNDWSPQAMQKDKDSKWSLSIKIPPGEYGYNYLVDGRPIRDPNNFKICDKGKGFPSSYLLVKPLEGSKKSEQK